MENGGPEKERIPFCRAGGDEKRRGKGQERAGARQRKMDEPSGNGEGRGGRAGRTNVRSERARERERERERKKERKIGSERIVETKRERFFALVARSTGYQVFRPIS